MDADRLQEGKQDWAYAITHLIPRVQPGYVHERETRKAKGPVQTAGGASQRTPSSPEPFNSQTSQMDTSNLKS